MYHGEKQYFSPNLRANNWPHFHFPWTHIPCSILQQQFFNSPLNIFFLISQPLVYSGLGRYSRLNAHTKLISGVCFWPYHYIRTVFPWPIFSHIFIWKVSSPMSWIKKREIKCFSFQFFTWPRFWGELVYLGRLETDLVQNIGRLMNMSCLTGGIIMDWKGKSGQQESQII